MIKVELKESNRIRQGDILKDIELIESIEILDGNIEIRKIIFPYTIVLTQDCDLEQEFKNRQKISKLEDDLVVEFDKYLVSVLLAPIYNIEHIWNGEHLSLLGLKMQSINKNRTPGQNIMNNDNPRYHYLEFSSEVNVVNSVIDFKHYFSVNLEYLNKNYDKFICSVSELYRENISMRFANYLSRIGLPSEINIKD